MKVVVKRSPARVCWHVKLGEQLITTAQTKHEANRIASQLNREYFNGV